MFSTDTWLTIACSLMTNAVLFGIGAITVLSISALQPHLNYLLPAIIIASFVLSPLPARRVALRMRIRNWGRAGWQRGDAISG